MSVISGIMGANATEDAANTAAAAQNTATDSAERINAQNRADFARFLNPSDRALATLQSAIYGGPQTYKDGATTQTAQFAPQESESYKAVKGQTLADLGRYYRSLGRGNSTAAMNATGRTLTDLNYKNEEDQKNQLWNLVKTGQGAAGSITGSNNTLSDQIRQGANSLGTIAMNQGNNLANLYSGISSSGVNAASAGIKAYNSYNQPQGTTYNVPANYDYSKSYGDQ